MAHSENFTKAIAALNALTAEELNDLVPHWKAISKHKRAVRGATIVASGKFNVGDVLMFDKSGRGRHAGRHYFIFNNLNRAGTGAQGPECDKDGNKLGFTRWTVDVSKCTVVKKVGA